MKYNYNFSIIVPLYNAENTIKETIESVLSQNFNGITFEILLLNDGSVDNTDVICKQYEDGNKIKYFEHENKGVSYTRNRGLDLATGKYILFLDADDLIAEDTLSSVYETFEKYYEYSDVLAYPIYSLIDGEILEHPRTNNYKSEALYDVDGFAFLNQVTMNIVIKNLEEKVYFDETLFQSEDAYFNANMIFRTKKLIICNKGAYLYRTNRYSTVQKYTNPVAIGDKLLELFEKYCDNFMENGVLFPYIQSSILYEINWRFKANSLYPFHLNQKGWKEWEKRFNYILGKISDEVILKQNFMDYYHKIYFIEQKYKDSLSVNNDSKNIYIKNNDIEIIRYDKFTLVFERMDIGKNGIEIFGYIKAPLLNYLKNLALIIYKNDKEFIKITEFSLAADSRYKSKQITNIFYSFNVSIPIDDEGQYKFAIAYNGLEYLTNHYFMDSVIFKKYLNQQYIVINNKYISYYSNSFCINIVPISKLSYAKNYLMSQKNLIYKGFKSIALFKTIMELLPEKEIWLYNDRINVFDNAYLQFKHDFYKKDGIDRYYITYENEDFEDKFTNEEKKYLVKYNSLKHKALVYKASMILTSFQNVYEYCPFSNIAINLLYEKMNYKVVYLQHGILHAHTPWIYSKDKTKIDYFLTSSNYEKEMLINNYNYLSENIINLLMPRFDNISATTKENKILFAPSWRISLTNGIKNLAWQLDEEKFMQSKYFKEINNFINSKELVNYLEENNLILDFNLHPIFKGYSHCFQINSTRVKMVKDTEEISKYRAFITDFSSFVFDFVKLNIPVLFFIPDYKEFLSGNHIYNRLELDLNETFGPVIMEQTELVNALKSLSYSEFSIADKYKNNYNNFFNKIENPKEALYKKLIEVK
ncbi:glycosyltransferase [Solibacillus sp. CAU 1738]|uniref:glycosyltransferase n=1 Tax=Solibacillus sp. CAU 1738 TaxID=3140363 RepID=UPI00325FFCCC